MSATMAATPRRFLFVMWEGGGNVPPQLGIARRLVERGHAVRVISDPCNEAEVVAAGCTFVPYTLAPHRHDKSRESTIITDWEAQNPPAAFALLREQLMFGPALAFAKDVLAELERQPADVVAINDALFGGMIAAEKAGVPHAVLMPNCYLGPAHGFPLAGLRPMRGPIGRLRDAVVGKVLHRMVAKGVPALNAARTHLGLAPVRHPFDQLIRADRVLVLTSLAFDFPAAWLPSNVRYVGPQLDDPAWTERAAIRMATPCAWRFVARGCASHPKHLFRHCVPLFGVSWKSQGSVNMRAGWQALLPKMRGDRVRLKN